MRRGTNLPRMAGFNQTVILDVVRRADAGLTRAQLARRTGLSAQTVTNATRRLLEQGLVREEGESSRPGPGRPGTLLHLDPRRAVRDRRAPRPRRHDVRRSSTSPAPRSRSCRSRRRCRPAGPGRRRHRAAPSRSLIASRRRSTGRCCWASASPPRARSTSSAASSSTRRTCPAGTASRCVTPSRSGTGLPVILDKDTIAAASAHLWTRACTRRPSSRSSTSAPAWRCPS